MKREYFSMRRQGKLLLVSVALLALTFSGCGAEDGEMPITENSLVVTEEGKLVSYMVDAFDKDYYDAEELKAMAVQEAAAFSAEHQFAEGDEMIVRGVEVRPESKQVELVIEFANGESYGAYFGAATFYGTVLEAQEAGWFLSGKLTDTKKNTILTDEKLRKYGKKMILISEHEVDIRMPKKIIAEGEDAGLKYIMMK